MSKILQMLVVMVSLIILAGVGLTGGAWADRLQGSAPSAALSAPEQVVQAAGRPQGTVITAPVCVKTATAGKFTIGSVAEWTVSSVPGTEQYEACVAKPSNLPPGQTEVFLSAPIKLTATGGSVLGVAQTFCLPVPPGKTGAAYFWDGKTWIKTQKAVDGKACVTVPAGTLVPFYVALLQEP